MLARISGDRAKVLLGSMGYEGHEFSERGMLRAAAVLLQAEIDDRVTGNPVAQRRANPDAKPGALGVAVATLEHVSAGEDGDEAEVDGQTAAFVARGLRLAVHRRVYEIGNQERDLPVVDPRPDDIAFQVPGRILTPGKYLEAQWVELATELGTINDALQAL